MTSFVYRTDHEARELVKRHCAAHGISVNQLLRGRRDSEVMIVRRRIARELRGMGWTTVRIGKLLNRDHSSISVMLRGGKGRLRTVASADHESVGTMFPLSWEQLPEERRVKWREAALAAAVEVERQSARGVA